jgi:hypothetical protein
MTTQEIIESLRELAAMPDYVPVREMRAAADRLEELQRLNDSMQTDRDLWIKVGREKLEVVEKECDQFRAEIKRVLAGFEVHSKFAKERDDARAEVERLKAIEKGRTEIGQYKLSQQTATRPEPSRLEIAAMLKAGWFANRDADFNATDQKWWIEQADALIAAAKEAK